MQTECAGRRPVLLQNEQSWAWGKGMVSGPQTGITIVAEVFPWHSQSHRVVGSEPILGEDKNVASVQVSKAWGQKLPD